MKKTAKKGFTLVELMVVIVIIGILAALAIPRFLGATNKTKAAEFKPILKQVFTLQEAYYQERDAYTTVLADLAFEVPNATTARFGYTAIAPARAANAAIGKADYIAGKGINTPGGAELADTDAACVDVEGDMGATNSLASLASVAKINVGGSPASCP